MTGNSAKFVPMCGRYSNSKDSTEMMKLVDAVMRLGFVPRYNIAPTQMAPVIYIENKKPEVKLMRWGLVPHWAKDEATGGVPSSMQRSKL